MLNFYPMRPINGGSPGRAFVKDDQYYLQAKYNGWRVIVNAKTGKAYNRHRQPLSIDKAFKDPISQICDEYGSVAEWADCEGLERRHKVGLGTLILLDLVLGVPDNERIKLIEREGVKPIFSEIPENGELYRVANATKYTSALEVCNFLKQQNSELGSELFEGVVAKRIGHVYKKEFSQKENANWIKYRF